MQLRLFLLLILFSATTSFFWEDEEKQLRQLHQSGEMALQKGDFEVAKVAFEELLSRSSILSSQKHHIDWATYVDVSMRLSMCYEELNEKKEAEKILKQLLAKCPPEEFIPRIKLMKARLTAMQESPLDAYLEIRSLASKFPQTDWSSKDRTFFHALEHSLDIYFDNLMAKAKRFFTAGCYSEASTMYEEILSAVDRGCYPKAKNPDSLIVKKMRYRLAECYFLTADYAKSLFFCESQQIDDKKALEVNKAAEKTDKEMLYLSALCYKEKKEFEKALDIFQSYTHLGDRDELDHYDHALFEIGYYYYQHGNPVKARRYFEKLYPQRLDLLQHQGEEEKKAFNNKSTLLAALYLARICLDQQDPKNVERLLSQVIPCLNPKDPMCYECHYLRGLAAYTLGEYAEAKDCFERSFPETNTRWLLNSLYHLGWCYLRLGDDPLKAEAMRHRFFNRAEECFEQLLNTSNHEAAALSLAQICLLRLRHFDTNEPLHRLETLLQDASDCFSLDGELQALLLRAEGVSNYAEKERLYTQATDDKYQQTKSYPQAWYCRGINHFQEGLHDSLHGAPLFDLATIAFEKAFRSVERSDRQKAASFLKLEAKVNICRNSPITSLALLEKLLTQFEESVDEREETLYLRGLLASRFTDLSFFPLAEESLKQVIHAYPKGKYADHALFALANLYFGSKNYLNAKNIYARLGLEHPESPYAPEAWFWAAEAAANSGENPTPYRSHVYEDYPKSDQAAEAYFRQFPYSAYLGGTPEALIHLRGFTGRFSHSPREIVVNYLIGLHEENLESAKASFESSLSSFSLYFNNCEKYAFDAAYVHFYYQAMLELALRHMQLKHLAECEQVLTTLVSNFLQKDHPFASLLKQKKPYPSQFEEGEYHLVHCYLKQGKDLSAQRLLNQMLTHYTESGIEEGYYLFQVWQELGKLAMHCQDYNTALHYFELSHESGKNFLSDDQKLTLWLLQSDCFREKKEYDIAMRLLSKVINAQTASPLRLKAMFLRAEIYELEGRPELAIRQLESAAKKGGEWAHKAQEKLRTNYGME